MHPLVLVMYLVQSLESGQLLVQVLWVVQVSVQVLVGSALKHGQQVAQAQEQVVSVALLVLEQVQQQPVLSAEHMRALLLADKLADAMAVRIPAGKGSMPAEDIVLRNADAAVHHRVEGSAVVRGHNATDMPHKPDTTGTAAWLEQMRVGQRSVQL